MNLPNMRSVLPHVFTVILVITLVITQNAWAAPFQQAFDDPAPDINSTTSMNYQGQLFDASGNPLDGTVNLSFRIFDAPTGGNSLWGTESHNNTPVVDGLFDVALGETIPLSASMFGTNRWLQTTVNGEALSPRQQLLSVPVAQVALSVPDGTLDSYDIAPTMWVMDSGWMNVAVSGFQPYVEMTIQDNTASYWQIWWWGATALKTGATERGVVEADLRIDGDSNWFPYVVWNQAASGGSYGSASSSNMIVIELEPGVPHTLEILSGGINNSVLRRAKIIAMPIMTENAQNCSANWTSPTVIDVYSGTTRSDGTTCTVYNLPFAAP